MNKQGENGIGWCDYTLNPIVGCSPISEGCINCYAEAISNRFNRPWGEAHFKPERLSGPSRLKKPSRIFVCSMSDLFHESVPDEWIIRVFDAMAFDVLQPCIHTYMILTKRPVRMAEFFDRHIKAGGLIAWPNIWLGVTAENQARADERIQVLLRIPAAKRFVSVEPMLGPVDLRPYMRGGLAAGGFLDGLNWVIAGPETGPKARPCDPAWIDDLGNQCAAAGVAFYDKRKGGRKEWPK